MTSGNVRLRINAQNAGPAPRIYYVEDGPVSESSPQLLDQNLTTRALRVNFLVMDPSGHYETGEVVTWSNKLVLRNRLSREGWQTHRRTAGRSHGRHPLYARRQRTT